ncbi:DUF4168 domain-containing protein [Gillisia sp. Q332]|uniref:DUF4168 domain-containing protein n=1 Tax=Gillisia xinjiangensis TaxID=3384765 RepID=UPI00391C3977
MFKTMKLKPMVMVAGLLTATISFAQTTPMPQQQNQSQIEVTDAELNKFAKVFQGLQVANQDIQRKMMAVIDAEEMDVATFNKIQKAKLENTEVDAAPEDVKKHEKAVEKIEVMQVGFQKEMETLITNSGLSIERYQEIATAMQTNQGLQERLQKILMG